MFYSQEYFLGQILIWPSMQKIPQGFAICDGRFLPISEYEVLHHLLRGKFGLNSSSFALPDLRGRFPMGDSDLYSVGKRGGPGPENTVLASAWVPGHAALSVYTTTPPSLELVFIICTAGFYPSSSGELWDGFMGEIVLAACEQVPAGFMDCKGQTLAARDYACMYALIAGKYGGRRVADTVTLPDMSGRFPLGAGQSSDPDMGPPVSLGAAQGTQVVQVPTSPFVGSTSLNVPTMPPFCALKFLLAIQGMYPTPGDFPDGGLLGEIVLCAYNEANFKPSQWLPCDGRLLLTSQYPLLQALIGNTSGGDGQTNFALPDLQGRFPMGATSPESLGKKHSAAPAEVVNDAGMYAYHVVWSPPSLGLQFFISIKGEIV